MLSKLTCVPPFSILNVMTERVAEFAANVQVENNMR
jgi:hypothetical protein